MHTSVSSPQAHGAAGFLPWHRAYLLDLERELQAIDPSVALPYWRFDQPAPNLFTRDFLGVSDALGTVQFSADQSAAVLGDRRRPGHQPPALLQHRRRRRPASAPRRRRWRLGTQYAAFRDHGRQPARLRAHQLRRLDLQHRRPPPAIRCSSCCTATSIGSGRSGSGRFGRFNPAQAASYDSNPRQPDRPQPARHDVAVERRDRRSASADGARRRAGRVAVRRARPAPQPRVRDSLDYQGVRQRRRPGWGSTTTMSPFA